MLLMSVLYIASMPAGTLFPSVKWCQKLHFIALSVYVREFVPDNINVTKLYMQFSGSGIGASGSNKYAFEIHFYKEIETESELQICLYYCYSLYSASGPSVTIVTNPERGFLNHQKAHFHRQVPRSWTLFR